ncbi:NADH-quinone oxidoreductase subunit N [Halovenus marina]|uniref:NADH-quinone oxidoreductase subunit N n=1 Tax=Halovenus marina TaxID=3396621 RepID=UPI003F565BC3
MSDIAQLPDWMAVSPVLVLLGGVLLLFVLDMIDPDSRNSLLLSGTAAVTALASLSVAGWFLAAGTGQERTGGPIQLFDGALVVDGMALFVAAIVTSVTLLVVVGSYEYLSDHPYQAEYYSLMLLAATGMATMGAANSFVTAFIALELASLPSYALVASLKTNKGSAEGGLKYFLIGALSSAVFVYGVSLVYADTGVLQFDAITDAIVADGASPIVGLGMLFILGGIAFKTASVPFHFWAPDAYEGAPAPVSAFISSASKAAGFVLGFRIFVEVFPHAQVVDTFDWVVAFQVLAVVTMTVANLAALKQEKVKRMLAYSSIAHAGYVLIALGALTGGADQGLVLGAGLAHLLVYGFMNTGAFLFIALTEHWDVGRTFEDFNGLARSAPFACAAMTIFLFSLAGLPMGAGFLSKFYLLLAAVNGGVALLAVALVLNSVVSLYYYSRVVKAMWIEEPATDREIESYPTGLYVSLALAALVTVLLLPAFGPVVELAQIAAEGILP